MTPSPDHAELRRLAEAVPKEDWERLEIDVLSATDHVETAIFVAAANPTTVLALLSEIEELKGKQRTDLND